MSSEKKSSPQAPVQKMRIDKWLWCARFYKTRSLATQAVESGKIKVDDQRVKPARDIAPGNQLAIQIGEYSWQIEVLALSPHRSAAPLAQSLYCESEASQARRQQQIGAHQASRDPHAQLKGRPSKRDRRQIKRFVPI